MKYIHAPVSEVIIGVTFAESAINVSNLFQAQHKLSELFPLSEIRPPIANESLVEFRLSTELLPEQTGPMLIRMRSKDKKWLCQIQKNKVYLNWIRSDVEDVGSYVGFTNILKEFTKVISILGLDFKDCKIKYYDLTYHDRLEWQDYVGSISDLTKIMKFCPPAIDTPEGFNNFFTKYTYHFPDLGGFGILSINTDTSAKGQQVIKFENIIRGYAKEMAFDAWIEEAHKAQFQFFEQMFTEETLSKWK